MDRVDEEWEQKSLDSLKKTNTAELEKTLTEKMNAGEKPEKGLLDQFIGIKPQKAD